MTKSPFVEESVLIYLFIFLEESVLRNLDTHIPRMSYLIPYEKINSKGIKSKTKNYKTTKIKSKKIGKWDYIKLKYLAHQRKEVIEWKAPYIMGENPNHRSYKGLTSRIYKQENERHFYQENIWLFNKWIKGCSTSKPTKEKYKSKSHTH